MRNSDAELAARCGREAQECSPVTASPTETGREMKAPGEGDPEGHPGEGDPRHHPGLASRASSPPAGEAVVRAHRRRPALQCPQGQRPGSSAGGQARAEVASDSTGRRVRKRTAIWSAGEWGSESRYNLRAGRRETAGAREQRLQKEFDAEIGTEHHAAASSEVLSSTDAPGGRKRHPGAEGEMIASSIAGQQASPTKETVVQVTGGPQTLAGGRGAETRGQVDDGAGVLAGAGLKGSSHQSHGGGVGDRGSPRVVLKEKCSLETTTPGKDSGEEMGKAIQAGAAVHASLAKAGAAPPVTFPSHTEPEVAADDDARAPPRPEQSPAELLHFQPEPSVGDLHNDVWVLRVLEAEDAVGSSGFAFASVSPPTCEDQPLPWNHQLIQNLSTEPSPASSAADPCDGDVPPSISLSPSQLNSVMPGERECEQAYGKQENATHLLCGLVTELSTLNRMVMAAHRELESLRRGRTLKPPLRRPYCPRRAEPTPGDVPY